MPFFVHYKVDYKSHLSSKIMCTKGGTVLTKLNQSHTVWDLTPWDVIWGCNHPNLLGFCGVTDNKNYALQDKVNIMGHVLMIK